MYVCRFILMYIRRFYFVPGSHRFAFYSAFSVFHCMYRSFLNFMILSLIRFHYLSFITNFHDSIFDKVPLSIIYHDSIFDRVPFYHSLLMS